MIKQYRKKPVIIEAVQWEGTNIHEIEDFMGVHLGASYCDDGEDFLIIQTLEGDMRADKGDYIIKGVQGEFYPCKPDIFEQTYEEIFNIEFKDLDPQFGQILNEDMDKLTF